MVGITPRAARRRMRVDEFVATLAGRVYPHRPPTAVRTATLSVS
jgi:hypothetical protein